MNYRPLPDNLTIKPSHIEGLGVFATETIKDINKNEELTLSYTMYNPN